MRTIVYKDFDTFLQRNDKVDNGVSPEFAVNNSNYVLDNLDNRGCWNCNDCILCMYCNDCTSCTSCGESFNLLRCVNMFDCSNCKDYGLTTKGTALTRIDGVDNNDY